MHEVVMADDRNIVTDLAKPETKPTFSALKELTTIVAV